MKQRFRAHLEAHYVGKASMPAVPVSGEAVRYETTIFRGVLCDIALLDETDPEPPATNKGFFQDVLEGAELLSAPGRRGFLETTVRDLHVPRPRFTHAASHDGQIYGRLAGLAFGWFELPPEPMASELRAEMATPGVESAEARLEVVRDEGERDANEALPTRAHPAVRAPGRSISFLPWVLSLAILLFAATEPKHAGYWLLFLVPTLVLRRFLQGIIEDAAAIRAFGAALILAQLVQGSMLISSWATGSCIEQKPLALMGVVACVFLAGLLPYAMPLAVNALVYALVLLALGRSSGKICGAPEIESREVRPPTVAHPGVPRTNDDGTWPRRASPSGPTEGAQDRGVSPAQ